MTQEELKYPWKAYIFWLIYCEKKKKKQLCEIQHPWYIIILQNFIPNFLGS